MQNSDQLRILTSLPLRRAGVTLLVMTLSVILLSISLSVALPRVEVQVRRQKEDELRFILKEFRQACERFSRVHERQPEEINELVADSHGRRFLRRPYPDPITGKFDWVGINENDKFVVRSASNEPSLKGAPYSDFR